MTRTICFQVIYNHLSAFPDYTCSQNPAAIAAWNSVESRFLDKSQRLFSGVSCKVYEQVSACVCRRKRSVRQTLRLAQLERVPSSRASLTSSTLQNAHRVAGAARLALNLSSIDVHHAVLLVHFGENIVARRNLPPCNVLMGTHELFKADISKKELFSY